MWLIASDVVNGDPSQPIVVALISALGGVIAAAFAALVSLARRESRDQHNPPTAPSLGERAAVLEQRAQDTEEALDVQDRRLDRIERHLDREHPEWRP